MSRVLRWLVLFAAVSIMPSCSRRKPMVVDSGPSQVRVEPHQHASRHTTPDAATLAEFRNAARNGEAQRVEELLQRGVDPNLKVGSLTILLDVLRDSSGYAEAVPALLGHGANPNVSDEYRRTPLMYAADYYDAETVRLLIARGAR